MNGLLEKDECRDLLLQMFKPISSSTPLYHLSLAEGATDEVPFSCFFLFDTAVIEVFGRFKKKGLLSFLDANLREDFFKEIFINIQTYRG
jgi:hypothetical protein